MPPTKSKQELKKIENDQLQAILIDLLRDEGNKHCADCDAKQPRWASWNLGVFLCIRCAGIHRSMGVHISKVKSVNLDSWTAEQVQMMRIMGNTAARQAYEAQLSQPISRPATDAALEAFIRAKYQEKRYKKSGWNPPVPRAEDLSPALNSANSTPRPKIAATNTMPPPVSITKSSSAGNDSTSLVDLTTISLGLTKLGEASSNNLEDLFGPMVSSISPAPHDDEKLDVSSTVGTMGSISSITSELSGLFTSQVMPTRPKTNDDIMALFGNSASQPNLLTATSGGSHVHGPLMTHSSFGGLLNNLSVSQQMHSLNAQSMYMDTQSLDGQFDFNSPLRRNNANFSSSQNVDDSPSVPLDLPGAFMNASSPASGPIQ